MEVDISSIAKQSDTDVIVKNSALPIKRKCLFPYANETKKIFTDDKSRILIELDNLIAKEAYFSTKSVCTHVYINSPEIPYRY